MSQAFEEHRPRYLFFAPGEKVDIRVDEIGPHAMGRIAGTPGADTARASRSWSLDLPASGDEVIPVEIDAALSGRMEDFLQSESRVAVHFRGSLGTEYTQVLRPQGATERWSYLLAVREPGATWYFCSTPCKQWKPTKIKPLTALCPYCGTGVIVAT